MQGSNFTDNHAPTSQGGAISVTDNSTAQVTNCTFYGNGAQRGAAVYAANSSLTVVDSIFIANTARSGGKALTSPPPHLHSTLLATCCKPACNLLQTCLQPVPNRLL